MTKYRVKTNTHVLGYVRAKSSFEAWAKARLKWGMLVASVDQM